MRKLELEELKSYIKKQYKKIKKEGSTTAGVPGFQTAMAFSSDKNSGGTQKVNLKQGQFAYSIEAPKKKRNFVNLYEVSYKNFKEDPNMSEVQKINNKILEVNKTLREISRALDHSLKLKEESATDNFKYWKRTNEAILKINKRLAEVSKKARKLANINEIAAASVKQKLTDLLKQAGVMVDSIDYNQVKKDYYEFDIYVHGEPYAIDYDNGDFVYMDVDKQVPLGNMNKPADLIKNLAKILKSA